MNKIKPITDRERNKYQPLQGIISFNISKLINSLPSEELNTRRFYNKLNVLNDYIKEIKDIDRKADKKGLLDVFRNDDKYAEELQEYKNGIILDLNKLELCSKCQCLSCEEICPFSIKGCNACNPQSKIVACDKTRYRVINGFKETELYNNDTDEYVNFEILGILEDMKLNEKYIYLVHKEEGILSNGDVPDELDERILGYKEKTNGDVEYTCIETFEEINNIYQIFVDLGISAK